MFVTLILLMLVDEIINEIKWNTPEDWTVSSLIFENFSGEGSTHLNLSPYPSPLNLALPLIQASPSKFPRSNIFISSLKEGDLTKHYNFIQLQHPGYATVRVSAHDPIQGLDCSKIT